MKFVLFPAVLAAVLTSSSALAQGSGAAADVKPVPKTEQEKLNKAIGNEQDAKVKIAPIGQSDKDNINKAVDWVEEKLRLRPVKKAKGQAPSDATAPADQ